MAIPGRCFSTVGEYGDFTDWQLHGPTDYVGVSMDVANTGMYGAFFGAIRGVTTLTYQVPTVPGQQFNLEFHLANPIGGSGTYFEVDWDGRNVDNIADSLPIPYHVLLYGPLQASPTSLYPADIQVPA